MNEVNKEQKVANLLETYSETFGDIGNLGLEYHMRVNKDVEPIVAMARKIPF